MRKHDICTCENNVIFTLKDRRHCYGYIIMPLAGQKCLTKMVLYFSGFVIIVNRMLNGHLEIQNFFSSFENISLVCCADTLAIFFNSRREISYLCTAM